MIVESALKVPRRSYITPVKQTTTNYKRSEMFVSPLLERLGRDDKMAHSEVKDSNYVITPELASQ